MTVYATWNRLLQPTVRENIAFIETSVSAENIKYKNNSTTEGRMMIMTTHKVNHTDVFQWYHSVYIVYAMQNVKV